METQVGVWLMAALLLMVLDSATAEDKYIVLGGKLELRPTFSNPITSVLWKHDGNLVAEWVDGKIPLFYYPKYDGRTTLDIKTGRLEITNTSPADSGLFLVEINSNVQSPEYKVKMIKEVTKVEVFLRPVSCNGDSLNCTLSCDGDIVGAEPVTYSWKEGDGEWKVSGKDILIVRTETRHVETYSCKIKNPVSEKESKTEKNPFFEKTNPNPSAVVAKVVVPVILLLVGVGVGLGFWKRDFIRNKISKFRGSAGSTKNEPSQPRSESTGMIPKDPTPESNS